MSKGSYVIILTACVIASAAFTSHVIAEVYKTVDADGNVVYTDTPPSPDAEPLEMRELSVIETVKITPRASQAYESDANAEGEVTDLGALRRGYRDFRLVSPTQEQTFWGTGNVATVAWDTRFQLEDGMAVTIFIDGEARPPTTASVISVGQLDRGQHTVSAELTDSRNRRIARADPVTFHIKQHSANFNRPIAAPRRGG